MYSVWIVSERDTLLEFSLIGLKPLSGPAVTGGLADARWMLDAEIRWAFRRGLVWL